MALHGNAAWLLTAQFEHATIARKGHSLSRAWGLVGSRGEKEEKKRGGGGGIVNDCGDGVGGGYVYGVGEEKVIDNFAYSFAWSLYIMCRDPLQKDRGRGDVFFEGCVWKWKEG